MNRIITIASVVVTVALVLRPEPPSVLLATERKVVFDTLAHAATVHATLRNNTRDSTYLIGCLGNPSVEVERRDGGRWIKTGAFPCPLEKAYHSLTMARQATFTVPLRIRAPGEYRLRIGWGYRGNWVNLSHHTTSEPFEVR